MFVEYAIREVQQNQEGLELKGTHQNSAYTVDVNLLLSNNTSEWHNEKCTGKVRRYWGGISGSKHGIN
jgi:hypothetical protein